MRALFVTPSEVSSGEAVTALRMADEICRAGGEVRFLASRFTARLAPAIESLEILGPDPSENVRTWDRVAREFRPETVVFADYPLLFFANGVAPLVSEDWLSRLDGTGPALVTLDHLGYAQGPKTLFFGPSHLSFHAATFPALPEPMRVLLPCPSHDPGEDRSRTGIPFRYWDPPADRAPRGRDGGLLVLHATPQWAWRMAERFGLPYYRFLPSLLEHYLGELPVPVTVVSVNNGTLLPPVENPRIRVVNLGPLPAGEYERLLLGCDLLLSENGVSVSIGKAVCAGVPCVLLRNSFGLTELLEQAEPVVRRIVLDMEAARLGAVFPYEVFPLWRREEVPLAGPVPGCTPIEVFGGEPSRHLLHRLLLDDAFRTAARTVQQAYADRVAALPGPQAALQEAVARS
ncbi:MAG: DUF6365 family protein [Actinomycetota bacterium]|nr:DUF6365 family protein [Actinomycetota bacterium]